MMTYLNFERLNAIAFQHRKPYPWINPEGLLTEEGYRRLLDTLPAVSLFEQRFGENRKYGQKSHDRFALEYHNDLDVSQPWKEFVSELQGKDYHTFLRRLMGIRSFALSFHWHYTPNGGAVSPHCDAKRKLGSHIFYFNTSQDWDPVWGGETLILDDGGRFDHRSNPAFEDFDQTLASRALDNRSLLFCRKGNSWHGVREIRCPQGAMRKVFIVVIEKWNLCHRLRRRLGYDRNPF